MRTDLQRAWLENARRVGEQHREAKAARRSAYVYVAGGRGVVPLCYHGRSDCVGLKGKTVRTTFQHFAAKRNLAPCPRCT